MTFDPRIWPFSLVQVQKVPTGHFEGLVQVKIGTQTRPFITLKSSVPHIYKFKLTKQLYSHSNLTIIQDQFQAFHSHLAHP
jgi:hypothetical protein